MPRRDRDRLLDMLDAATKAVRMAQGHTRSDLDGQDWLSLSLTRLLEIVGEAANHVSDEGRAAIPTIPWSDVIGMRNRLIHAYFAVDHDILWHVVTEDLPALIEALDEALAKLPE